MVYTSKVTHVEENVDILGTAPSTVIMPNFNTTLESAIFVGSFIEEAYTDFMTSIGRHELAVYESTGSEIVYEAEDGQETAEKVAFKDKAMNFFKEIWARIKKLFEVAIENITGWIRDAKSKKLDKLKAAWNTKKNIIKDDKTFGKVRFCTNLSVISTGGKMSALSMAAKKLESGEETDPWKAFYSDGRVQMDTVNDAKDIKPALMKALSIPEQSTPATKSWVDTNIGKLSSIIIDGADLKSIKNDYQTAKKTINDIAKNIKNSKAEDASKTIKAVKSLLPILLAIEGATIDVIKARYHEAKNIMVAVGVALKLTSKPKEEGKDEEAPAAEEKVGESAIISTIETAFDW